MRRTELKEAPPLMGNQLPYLLIADEVADLLCTTRTAVYALDAGNIIERGLPGDGRPSELRSRKPRAWMLAHVADDKVTLRRLG